MTPRPPLHASPTTAEEFVSSAAFVHAPVAYSVIDLEGNQIAANAAFRELFATHGGELVDVAGITHDVDRERTESYLRALREGRRDRVVVDKRYTRPDGTSFWGRLTASAVLGADGEPAFMIGVIQDLSDHVTSLAQARDASATKSRFVARVSHDLRTPLHAIGGLAELLGDVDLDPEHRRFADAIRAEAEALRTLVDDLLDLSRLEAGRVELREGVFDIGVVTHDVVALVARRARGRDVALSIEIDPSVDRAASGDGERVRQVLVNLVDNAVKFTDDHVAIRVGPGAAAGSVVFEVEDAGPGIDGADVERIFEPFAQAHGDRSGTGLGLSIARDLVEMMGGSLSVDSRPGEGSVFSFVLPLPEPGDADVTSAVQDRVPAGDDRPPPRVLVVEDSPINQLLAEGQLERLGCVAVIADRGEDALRRLEAESFDLVLMDWHLPDMDGLETTRRWRSREAATGASPVPIVAVTARAMTGDRERCIEAGMDDFLAKPVALDDLARVLGERFRAGVVAPDADADETTDVLLRLTEDLGDADLVRTLVRTFMAELPGRCEALRDAASAGDADRLRRTAHTLKSTSATVGAAALHRLTRDIELGAAGGAEDLRSLVAGLEAVQHATTTDLETALDRLPGPAIRTGEEGR